MLFAEYYFRTQSYKAVKQIREVHLPGASVPSQPFIDLLSNDSIQSSHIFYEYVETC